MSFYLSGKHILISGASPSRLAALKTELGSACGHEVPLLALDVVSSGHNVDHINDQLNAAFSELDNRVDLFVIDSRSHEPYGNDPIWEVPLSEWNQHHDEPRVNQQRVLFQARAFLQTQVHLLKEGTSLESFSIVILGYRDAFGDSLDAVVSKLQRDVSWLSREASVSFLDIESPASEASEQSLAGAVGIVVSSRTHGSVVPLNDIWRLRALGKDGDPAPAAERQGVVNWDTQKYQVADKVTWFIPGHTMETFEDTVREIVKSGAEIGLHGYAHEGAYQMTPEQEREVLVKCMQVSQRLTGKKVQGWRAPMYQLRETTVALLKEFGFLYDSSLSHHDSQPYFTPAGPPVERIDFSKPASSWLRPTQLGEVDEPVGYPLVEIPIGWNNEDMMALQYYPHLANTNGQVDARVIEQRWKDIFLWLWENAEHESEDGSFVFPLLMHPDSSGLAHAIAMADRFVGWLRSWGDSVEFHTYSSIAQDFLRRKGVSDVYDG
ncbi:Glycoside hydrolase/deacetylase, beta/alpha-barrel [Pleurostoma richardsiae]|uniref:Glycoside hydrolase/deacetylase, beta/alpha-barrel n=1 Tax=Pleurostoma richardsiae TaxID=41990 RepID=A0AA38R9B8_9PEZI|nr:Glycoside hydrolase/deacetylase, beta/alpha-barrel [Pleurostoma richardsiae]